MGIKLRLLTTESPLLYNVQMVLMQFRVKFEGRKYIYIYIIRVQKKEIYYITQ